LVSTSNPIIKPMRAENADLKKIKRWPVWVFPKVDGVRGYNPQGTLLSRPLKRHRNAYTTNYFSREEYAGFDGELAAEHECHPRLCHLTQSAVSTAEGTPFVLWHLFDYVTPESRTLPYSERYKMLTKQVYDLKLMGLADRLRVLSYVICDNVEQVLAAHTKNMELGYEGSCYYDPTVTHKEGKSSPTHGGVLRIKDFIDFEAEVLEVQEGRTNLNEAQVNELGRQFRSSHQENMVPNGMVGTLVCKALKDVVDPYDKKKILIAKDQIFNCSPGKMTDDEAVMFLKHPELIVGKPSTVKFFPKGMKDAPRFPQWQCIRATGDHEG